MASSLTGNAVKPLIQDEFVSMQTLRGITSLVVLGATLSSQKSSTIEGK